MDTKQLKLMKRHRRMYRFIGVMFVLVGGMLLFSFLPLLFDEGATINYNGILTSNFGVKLSAVFFNSAFVLVGLFFTFCPSKYLNKLFVWRQSFLSAITPWKK